MNRNPRRIGKFYISAEFYHHGGDEEQHAKLCLVMAGMVILRAEFLHAEQVFEYVAEGPMFEEVEYNAEAPEYVIGIRTVNNTITDVVFTLGRPPTQELVI